MAEPAPRTRMTVDEFLAWATEQPTGRYELFNGEVVAMAPERARHVEAKAQAWLALRDGARRAGLRCQALADGMAVRIDETTIFEPDASLRCGDRLDGAATEFDDPVVVVDVLSPATRGVDTGGKFAAYFRLPSVRHYLIVDAEKRTVIHHARDADGRIVSAIATEGVLALDPPGLDVAVADLFPPYDDPR